MVSISSTEHDDDMWDDVINISALIDEEVLYNEFSTSIPELNSELIENLVSAYTNSDPLTEDEFIALSEGLEEKLNQLSFFYNHINEYKFLAHLPRVNEMLDEDTARIANYKFQFERFNNDPKGIYLNRDLQMYSEENQEKAELVFSLHLIKALSTVEHKDKDFLLDLLIDRVKIIDHSLKSIEESGPLESLYFRLQAQFGKHQATRDLVKDLLDNKDVQPSEEYLDIFIELLNPNRYLSPQAKEIENQDIQSKISTGKDSLRRRFLISEKINPNTDRKKEIWTKAIDDIVANREGKKVFTFSSFDIFTGIELKQEQVSLEDLTKYEDYTGRGNQLNFIRNFIERICDECKIEEIHLKLSRIFSDEIISFFKENNPKVDNTNFYKDLQEYLNNTLLSQLKAFFNSSTATTFQSYLIQNGELDSKTVPTYIAHFLEMLELLKKQEKDIVFIDGELIQSDKKILILGRGSLSDNNLKDLKIEREELTSVHHSVYREDDDDIIYTPISRRGFLISSISSSHKLFSTSDAGVGSFATVASSTIGDEEMYELFNSYLETEIPENLRVEDYAFIIGMQIVGSDKPPADYYFTTVSNEPPKEKDQTEQTSKIQAPSASGV